MNVAARQTMTHNAPRFFADLDTDVAWLEDITETPPELLLERAGLQRSEAGLLHGGPPCVAFSKTGYWLPHKREDRERRPR